MMTGKNSILSQCVYQEIRKYFDCLRDEKVTGLYSFVLREVELPLLRVVLEKCRGNQTRAAKYLGISRGTLRAKLKHYQLFWE